jgi:hypothetical protein
MEILSANGSQRLLVSPTRLYDPVDGRFIQIEPIAGRRSRVHYLFARQNPLRTVDPTGLQDECGCPPGSNRNLPPGPAPEFALDQAIRSEIAHLETLIGEARSEYGTEWAYDTYSGGTASDIWDYKVRISLLQGKLSQFQNIQNSLQYTTVEFLYPLVGSPIHETLVGAPNRVVRGVDPTTSRSIPWNERISTGVVYVGGIWAGGALAAETDSALFGTSGWSTPGTFYEYPLIQVPDFASRDLAIYHFMKHTKSLERRPCGGLRVLAKRTDMPEFSTLSQYQPTARSFMSGPPRPGVLELTRADGTLVRYDPSSNYLGIRTPDGTVKTFFAPDAGYAYFLSQTQK